MNESQLIAVLGATGAQGGGLVRAILADPARTFAVRAISRRVDSPAARTLASLGAEVVQGDLDDLPSLKRAFAGAHGVFGVTRAAQDVGAGHVIWSTLEDTRERVPLTDTRMPTLMNRYKVPHFDAKGEADALFQRVPTRFLRTSFFWDNLNFVLPMGDRKLAGIAAADIGHVHSAFSGGDRISSAVRSALPASISPAPRWLRRARVGQA